MLFVRALALFGHRPQDETDIIEATKLFLSDANRQISDIVQLCETHHIPHSYDSISSYEQLFRIESDKNSLIPVRPMKSREPSQIRMYYNLICNKDVLTVSKKPAKTTFSRVLTKSKWCGI